MSTTWEQYKSTMAGPESDLFDLARHGRTSALREARIDDLEARGPRGATLLMLACYHGQTETARWLIDQGADLHTTDEGGNSALMGAAFKGNLEIVALLLEAGANRRQKNPKGQTALDFAHMFGRAQVAEALSGEQLPALQRLRRSLKSWTQYLFTKGTHQ